VCVIYAVLLKPLAYQEPDRVVILSSGATPIRYDEMKVASQSYTELGVYAGPEDMALSRVGQPQVLNGTLPGSILSFPSASEHYSQKTFSLSFVVYYFWSTSTLRSWSCSINSSRFSGLI